jgi:hypothetical protein
MRVSDSSRFMVIGGGIVLLLSNGARGQSRQRFEVAVIRPTLADTSAGTSFNVFEGGRLRITPLGEIPGEIPGQPELRDFSRWLLLLRCLFKIAQIDPQVHPARLRTLLPSLAVPASSNGQNAPPFL